MMIPAARFVQFRSSNDHNRVIIASRLSVDQALCPCSWLTAHHTNCMQLVHLLRLCHEDGHRTKWFASEIRVQASYNDPQSTVGQVLDEIADLLAEELGFVDSDHRGVII